MKFFPNPTDLLISLIPTEHLGKPIENNITNETFTTQEKGKKANQRERKDPLLEIKLVS